MLNKTLGFVDHFLLFQIRFLLLSASFLTQNQVMRIIGFVIVDATHRHFDRAVGDVVNEGFIVGNYDYRLGFVLQEIFQPDDRFNIDVVRRLIQQYKIRFLK